METYASRSARVMQQITSLGEISNEGRILTRLFGTKAHAQVNQRVLLWMNELGLETRIDNIGNVRGRLKGKEGSNSVFVMGSHLDSVRNAGKFDGVLGVLLALDLVGSIQHQGIELPFDIEVVGFSDEEGVRFNIAYMGSSVLAGNFQDAWLDKQGIYGKSLSSVLEEMGGEIGLLPSDAIPQHEWLGFLEIHTEQGPILFQQNLPVGIVESIAGQTRINLYINGTRGHAGTTPMGMRRDALATAAEFIHLVENYAMENKDVMVATVGAIHSYPNIANVIPSKVKCSLDIRSRFDDTMDAATAHLERSFYEILQKRGIKGQWELTQRNPSVICDEGLRKHLKHALEKSGLEGLEAMHGGAGHDAVAIAKVAPVAMLFVQCKNGIGHHPEEYVTKENIEAAMRVCDLFLEELVGN